MRSFKQRCLTLALAGLPLLAGCRADDEEIERIVGPQPGGDLFARYVAVGTSISAGLQSGGINDSTQAQAYPVLLARQANAVFNIPAFPRPGCPAPYASPVVVSTARVGGAPESLCTLRASNPPAFVSNLSIPGIYVAGFTNNAVPNNPPSADVYETLILGGRTQAEALVAARPTLVSVELGSNEVLNAAYSGDPALLPSTADFQASFARVVDAVKRTPAQEAVLLGISAFQTAAVQPGAFFFALTQGPGALLPAAAVNANCSPFLPTGQRNPLSGNLLYLGGALTAARAGQQISCANNAPFLLNASEFQTFVERVNAYNGVIQQAAQANQWIYINPNTVLPLADPSKFRGCQALNLPNSATPAPLTPAQFGAAVATTCPGPTAPNFFGSMVSFDFTHPTIEYHRTIANAIINALNAEHQLGIPRI